MEDVRTKKLMALYQSKDIFLCGPIQKEIIISNDCKIRIEQCGCRKIWIESPKAVSHRELYAVLTQIERLLLIFEGEFIELTKIEFESTDKESDSHLASYGRNIILSRPAFYKSADFLSYSLDKLVDFECLLQPNLYEKWVVLLEDLGVTNQVFMYAASNIKMPVDMKCSFLIEMAESLVELVKVYTPKFAELNPGERGTSLKNCIDALVKVYGETIFKKELSLDYDTFLTALINSRNNIMHIKRKQKKPSLNGSESVLYAQKICLLYRHVLLSLLGIEEKKYIDRLTIVVEKIDSWNGVSDTFFSRLSRKE